MMVRPSRFLNEKSGFWGLSVVDLAGLGYTLVFLHPFFAARNLDLLAFVVVAVLGYFLVSLRLRHRPKTIRDFLLSRITKWRNA